MTLHFIAEERLQNDRRITIGPSISMPAQSIDSQARQMARVLTGMSASTQQIRDARATLVQIAADAIDLAERL